MGKLHLVDKLGRYFSVIYICLCDSSEGEPFLLQNQGNSYYFTGFPPPDTKLETGFLWKHLIKVVQNDAIMG